MILTEFSSLSKKAFPPTNTGKKAASARCFHNEHQRFCLEVEPPETETAKRRIAFYERNGFTLNHFPYMQPPLGEDRDPLPLMIMTTGGAIEKDEFEHIRKTLYKKVYRSFSE